MSGGELPERARAWVLSCVAGATAVSSSSRLTGGLSADTRLLRVERESEPPLEVVLKRILDGERARLVAREAEVLVALADARLPYGVARVLGRDDTGAECDLPALLMSRLPGRIAVSADGWQSRVRALGEALAAFHAQRLRCPAALPEYSLAVDKRHEATPNVAELPDWDAVWRFVEQQPVRGAQLLHGDYHLGNALFEGERLTAIIDWASARRGLPELDVAYCRLDLSMLLGEDAPDRFLAAYEARAGVPVENVSRWDLVASVRAFPDAESWLPGWVDAGRVELTPPIIRARLRDFVQNSLRLV